MHRPADEANDAGDRWGGITISYRNKGEGDATGERDEHREYQTEKARKPIEAISKPVLCSVNPINIDQPPITAPKSAVLGFFLPNRNIFVPCSSKAQYYFIKKKIMEKKAKTRPKAKGFCYVGAQKEYNKLLNCSVRDGNDELYDMNSCQLEKVEYYE